MVLLGGFRVLVAAASAQLAADGYPDVRPVHDFTMRAIDAGADNTSELGRRLNVSKQAAAKTVAVLQERGYVSSAQDPDDARRKRLQVTDRGHDLLRRGEQIFDDLRHQWEQQVGATQVRALEEHLAALVGSAKIRFDTPGWVAREID